MAKIVAEKRDYRKELTDQLIKQLEEGTAPWMKPWVPQERPRNFVTGKPYNGINVLALKMQGHADPRWLTFKQAQDLHLNVKAGSKGTTVEYWQWEETKKEIDEETKEEKQVTKPLKYPRVMRSIVFNGTQINGLARYELTKEQSEKMLEESVAKAKSIIDKSEAKITYDQPAQAFYNVSQDSIHLPFKDLFKSEHGELSTTLHELAHWTGHESRLNRDTLKKYELADGTRAKEELRAEIASYFMGIDTGIGTEKSHTEQHAAYIKSWISALKEDKNEIYRAARDAEKITAFLCKDLDLKKEQEKKKQPERKHEEVKEYKAKTEKNTYRGEIISVTKETIKQKVGENSVVVHETKALKNHTPLTIGNRILVDYSCGIGMVNTMETSQQQASLRDISETKKETFKKLDEQGLPSYIFRTPQTEKNTYTGEIVNIDGANVYQKVSGKSIMLHQKKDFKEGSLPSVGDNMKISHLKGNLSVKPIEKELERELSL